MDSYEFLEAQKEKIERKRAEKIAEIIYDWVHESQVTHRRSFAERSDDDKATYRQLASRILAVRS